LHQAFCSNARKKCFYALQKQLCKNTIIEDDQSLSWSLIWQDTTKSKFDQKCDNKLFMKALKTLCSGFGKGIESTVAAMIYNHEGEYGGFYTGIIHKEGKCASVAVFRAHPTKGFVEIPIVATLESYRSQGLCKRLMESIEVCVRGLGIQHLILPSVDTRLDMWRHFGFNPIEEADLNLLFEGNLDNIANFQGTTLCLKKLTNSEYDDEP